MFRNGKSILPGHDYWISFFILIRQIENLIQLWQRFPTNLFRALKASIVMFTAVKLTKRDDSFFLFSFIYFIIVIIVNLFVGNDNSISITSFFVVERRGRKLVLCINLNFEREKKRGRQISNISHS